MGRTVDADEKAKKSLGHRTVDANEVNSVKLMGFRGVPPLIVSESGMYALTMRSNKPQAKRFRKDGAYINCQPNYTPTGQSRVDTRRGKGLSD